MSEKTGHNEVIPSDIQGSASETDSRQGMAVLWRVALGTVVVVALIITVLNAMRYNELEARKSELEAQVAAVNEDNEELQYLINAPVDKAYIERIARERLHLHYPDEDIFYSGSRK